jgi:7-keto-8-aminopelargonate synthetase-like enzyme
VIINKNQDIEGGGTWKSERVLITEQGRRVGVEGRAGRVLNFCSNNYLGLSVHNPDLRYR